MKRLTIILCFFAFANYAQSQNLAGTTIDATMGIMDNSVPCMVDAGTMFGLDIWLNNSGGCPGDPSCGFFQNIDPMYNTFYFKNAIDLPVCLTLNFTTGSCGFNTGFWIVDGEFEPSPPGSGMNPCNNNTVLQSSTIGGTTSVGFEVEGCSPFSINFHNGTFPSVQCTYSFTIEPDPLLDLRCGDDTLCVEKVRIGGTPVPTMTEWGLFLFGLILLTLGVVTIYNMSAVRIADK
ncbi:MAG: hypothetical protein R3275_00775 [Saprospiraceae bacterium]|nr:hypothetical protein [Saprospiraceae bacterium]